MRKVFAILFVVINSNISQAQNDCVQYTEINGLVIMEAENTNSDLGQWIVKNDVTDYKGTGHLEFTGNITRGGNPKSPISYTFQINTTGYYRVLLRSRKRIAPGDDQDKSNDCFIRVDGDFDPSPNAEERNYGDASLETLQTDTKIFGGNPDSWGKAFTLDLGSHNTKRVPVYGFKAGQTYTVTISGRSKQFNFDRIVFYKNGKYNLNDDKIQIMDATPETLCERTLSTISPSNHTATFRINSNPIKNKQLQLTHKKQQLFKIYTIQGKLLEEFATTSTSTNLNMSDYSSGIYILQADSALSKIVIP